MLLFAILGAGASYIAVPAAYKTAVPEATPGIYLPHGARDHRPH